MSVKLALLKSGEDVIADWKELAVEGENSVTAYLASYPYVVKLNQSDISRTGSSEGKASLTFFPWMPLSKDTEIPIHPDWVVTLVEPVDQVKESYEDKINDIEERKRASDSPYKRPQPYRPDTGSNNGVGRT